MNTDVMFSSKTDMWETPQDLFDEPDNEFHFSLDVCAITENTKCDKYYTPEADGLRQSWIISDGAVWCNPPYGREIGKWVQKESETAACGQTVVMLLPARTDTKWFHKWIHQKESVEVRFIKGRLKFGHAMNSAPFPSMIAIFYPH